MYEKIKDRFFENKNRPFHTHPQFVNYGIDDFNHTLSKAHYFETEIKRDGIILFDSGTYKLARRKKLNFKEIKERAQKYYNDKFGRAKQFLKGVTFYCEDGDYNMASFHLHQSAENFLRTIPITFILYGHKSHDLSELMNAAKKHTPEIFKAFPRDTPEEKRLFDLLQRAYIESRYNPDFEITKADIDALLPKIELLRDVGACFSVNNMLRAKCYEQRMEKGLSFLEFNYMIMQSYDFYYMFQHYGCNMQFGGDDQWSNMLGGTELIRRKLGKDAYAMTITLLTDSQGKKMGKTAGNAVWLDPNKTSPFEFYQYWRNVGDADVMKCIRMLTFLPLEQIDEMSTWKDQRLNEAKEILAYELTKMVHGEEEAEKAQAAARQLFSGTGDSANMPTTTFTAADLTDGAITLADLMVKVGLAPSKGEVRRLVQQGGVAVNDVKVDNFAESYDEAALRAGLIIKKGKKVFHKVVLE